MIRFEFLRTSWNSEIEVLACERPALVGWEPRGKNFGGILKLRVADGRTCVKEGRMWGLGKWEMRGMGVLGFM
jgi:hypothetical protein